MKNKIYVDFRETFTQEEKLKTILDYLYLTTSKDFITTQISEGSLEIVTSRKYKESCGCSVIYLGKKEDKSRKCYREINKRFPMYGLAKDLQRIKNVQESL